MYEWVSNIKWKSLSKNYGKQLYTSNLQTKRKVIFILQKSFSLQYFLFFSLSDGGEECFLSLLVSKKQVGKKGLDELWPESKVHQTG